MTGLQIIKKIALEKKERNIIPTHAIMVEISRYAKKYDRVYSEIISELNSLVEAKILKKGKTFNSHYYAFNK
jgi:hypothetical protein